MAAQFIPANSGFKLAWPKRGSAEFFFDDVLAWRVDDDGGPILAVTMHGIEVAGSISLIKTPEGVFHRRGGGSFGSVKEAREWCDKEAAERKRAKQTINGKVFVAFDSPQWRAWAKYRPLGLPELGNTGGWWFESEWPPTAKSA